MDKESEINIFGLTGNMGCGKSTVGEILQKEHNDVYLFDCDRVAKDLLFDKKNIEKVRGFLGEEVIDDGKINKDKVSKLIFDNPDKKQALEELIHPMVWNKLAKEIQKKDKNTIFLVESAIFFEIGKEKDIKKVIMVICDSNEQKNRIKKRNNWPDDQIEKRLKYQMPNDVKETKSLVVIDNNCPLEELKTKTEKLYLYMKNRGNYKLIL